jgi:hypothetical protein
VAQTPEDEFRFAAQLSGNWMVFGPEGGKRGPVDTGRSSDRTGKAGFNGSQTGRRGTLDRSGEVNRLRRPGVRVLDQPKQSHPCRPGGNVGFASSERGTGETSGNKRTKKSARLAESEMGVAAASFVTSRSLDLPPSGGGRCDRCPGSKSTGQPAGSIADDREDRRTLHSELRCVRGGWAKTLIGGGKAKEDSLAINGRPTTDLLSNWTRLRLRRGVRFTVGPRDAERNGSRSRATNGPGNGPEVGTVGQRDAKGYGSRSRATNGPGNGPEVGIVRDRETTERVQHKVCQQWWNISWAMTEVDRLRVRSRQPEWNRGTEQRIFGSRATTRGKARRRRGTRLYASGACCDESSPHHADGSFRQGGTRLRGTPNVEAYLIKAGHEQRHEGQAGRKVLSAAQEE